MLIKQKYWHTLFEASVLLKAINGVWETISGFALIFVTKNAIAHTFLGHLSTGAKEFAGAYILAHGLINIFLAYHLYRDRLWAFWVSGGFFSISIIYLWHRQSHTNSPFLYALIVFDIIFVFLTIHEYHFRAKMHALKLSQAK